MPCIIVTDLCTPTIPFMCITDIFDVIPIDQCEDMFGLVEDKVKVWKSVSNHSYNFSVLYSILHVVVITHIKKFRKML